MVHFGSILISVLFPVRAYINVKKIYVNLATFLFCIKCHHVIKRGRLHVFLLWGSSRGHEVKMLWFFLLSCSRLLVCKENSKDKVQKLYSYQRSSFQSLTDNDNFSSSSSSYATTEVYDTLDIRRNLLLHNKETWHTRATSADGSSLCELLKLSRPSDGLMAIKLWLMLGPGALWVAEFSGAFRGTNCPSGHGQLGSVYHAPALQTQGPSDKMSQDIPKRRAPSSRARARIHPGRWGNCSLWNAGIWLIHRRIRLNLQRLI